ncbi:regulatory factor, effector binding domain-containing protein [Powellomyces hirtus]|nr:regulatory factor, effector binding domain-containing protein [Powellomyces hirtus]
MSNIRIETVPALRFASHRETISNFREQGRLWNEFLAKLAANGVVPAGATFTLLHDATKIDVEVCAPVGDTVPSAMDVHHLPERRMAICTHKGALHDIAKGYEQMMEWLKDQKEWERDQSVPSREVYIDTEDFSNCHIEVQYPVSPKKLVEST